MPGWKRFEDMEAWKEVCQLVCEVYAATRGGEWTQDRSFQDQVRRAALSVPDNIAEGFERDSDKAFANALSIAKGSSGELRTQFYIAAKLGYLDSKTMGALVRKGERISRKLAKLIDYLRKDR